MKKEKGKKLTLKKISVQSFVTELEDKEARTVMGGSYDISCQSPLVIVCHDNEDIRI